MDSLVKTKKYIKKVNNTIRIKERKKSGPVNKQIIKATRNKQINKIK